MNICDMIIVLIWMVSLLIGYQRGLIRSLYHLCRWGIAWYLDYLLYPVLARALRGTALYGWLKDQIITSMHLEDVTKEMSLKAQTALLNQLPQSEFILKHLQANNNPEVYKTLNVSGLADYVGGFFASMGINLISLLLVFVIVSMVMRIFFGLLDLLAQLPVLHALNKTGGLVLGFVQGLLFVWILLAAAGFFFLKPQNEYLFQQVKTGMLSKFLYEHNPVMNMLVGVVS